MFSKTEEGRLIALRIMTMRKIRLNVCKAALLLLASAAVLSGCGKTQKFTGGEDIGYPYTYEINSNGTVTVTLDGSASPDAKWDVTGVDEDIIKLDVKKAEKAGKITYKVEPVSGGSISISFQRVKETDNGYADKDYSAYNTIIDSHKDNPDKYEEITGPEAKHRDDVVSDDMASEEVMEDLPTPDENEVSADEQKLNSSSIICSIAMNLSITPSDRKNKFVTEAIVETEHLTEGVFSGEQDDVLDYEAWIDEGGSLLVRLPLVNMGWTYSSTGVFKETEQEEIPGIQYDEPEKDENGNYIILDIGEYGYYDKDQCFIINGLANGDATVVFTDMGNAYRLTLVVSINEGRVSLESQKMERTE